MLFVLFPGNIVFRVGFSPLNINLTHDKCFREYRVRTCGIPRLIRVKDTQKCLISLFIVFSYTNVVLCMFNELRWGVVRFVDIGGIVDHHCLNFIFAVQWVER